MLNRFAGRTDLARAQLEAARAQLASQPHAVETTNDILFSDGTAALYLGDRRTAVENAERLVANVERAPFMEAVDWHLAAAQLFAGAEEIDRAVAELDRYLAAPGSCSVKYAAKIPRFDPIRDDPKFKTLVAKYERR